MNNGLPLHDLRENDNLHEKSDTSNSFTVHEMPAKTSCQNSIFLWIGNRMRVVPTLCLKRLLVSTFIFSCGLPSRLVAQDVLDTARANYTTAKIFRIAPSERENWYFSRVAEIATDSRGQIFVLDDLACTIHVFNSNGIRIRQLGRKGSGPGEFDRPRALQVLGDTVFVVDRGNMRFVSFSAVTGAVISNRRGQPGQIPIGLSPRGVFQLNVVAPSSGFTGKAISSIIVHHDSQSKTPQTIGTLPFNHGYLTYPVFRSKLPTLTGAKGGLMQTVQPFDDTPLYQVSGDGRSIVMVDRAPAGSTAGGLNLGRRPTQITIRVVKSRQQETLFPNGRFLHPHARFL